MSNSNEKTGDLQILDAISAIYIILPPSEIGGNRVDLVGDDGAVNERGVYRSRQLAEKHLAEREPEIKYRIVRYSV